MNRTIFCSKSHLCLSQREWDSKTKQPIGFQGLFKVINKISGKWKAKSHCVENQVCNRLLPKLCCYCFSPKPVRFHNGSNKVAIELLVVKFSSEIILVISKITRMISDQIALHSVNYHYKNHQKIYKTAQNTDMWDEHRDSWFLETWTRYLR